MKNSLHHFALQSDVDMLTEKIIELSRSYGHMDFMVKGWEHCKIEQLAQAKQMHELFTRMNRIEQRMDALENRMEKLELKLDKLLLHFKIS